MVLVPSLPNLKSFFPLERRRRSPLPTSFQRRPPVRLQSHAAEIGIALAQCGLTSHKLPLTVCGAGLEQHLTPSSEAIVELQFYGTRHLGILREWKRHFHFSQIDRPPGDFEQTNAHPPFLFRRSPPLPIRASFRSAFRSLCVYRILYPFGSRVSIHHFYI
jgi:hypothetical protein